VGTPVEIGCAKAVLLGVKVDVRDQYPDTFDLELSK
jgi:hypothetical protein